MAKVFTPEPGPAMTAEPGAALIAEPGPDPVGHFCRRCGVKGGEQVPPSPLGWY